MTSYWCELAWLGGDEAASGVVVTVKGARIESVEEGVTTAPPGSVPLRGLTVPGLANVHSHAFQRVLRGRTHAETGSFWTWRDQMYSVSGRLDPDVYHRLARATFAEMALAGICVVGEFHYLHHQAGGTPYADPNAMGEAVLAAAAEAGIRVTLLDTCYLHGGMALGGYETLDTAQRRFGDGSAEAWATRVDLLSSRTSERVRIGAAVHSVRAVDPDSMSVIGEWVGASGAPVHIHLSEQPVENRQCLALHGRTPCELVADAGLLDTDLTAVHATHLTDHDISLLGTAGAGCCLCPTTERDLADGVGPARSLADAGAHLSLGSDSHAVIDLFEEARAVELDARLQTLERGHHSPVELLRAATANGHRSLGWPEGGRLETGAPADLTTIRLDRVTLAGTTRDSAVASAVFAATAGDVTHVVVDGEVVVRDGAHVRIDAAAELAVAIGEVLA